MRGADCVVSSSVIFDSGETDDSTKVGGLVDAGAVAVSSAGC